MKGKHIISRALKISVIVIISICVFLFIAEKFFWHIYSLPKYNEKEIQKFLQFKNDAETVNTYIIESFEYKANTDDNSILVLLENGKVTGLYDDSERIEIPEHLIDNFNNLKNGMFPNIYEFFIDIETGRISYGGLSTRMYVYACNGKAPTYFYHKGDGMHPEVYELGDNWYLLKVNYR